jgi:PKD repeat protein
MKKSMFLFLAIVALMVVMVASCKKTPAPTAKISASIEGYTVTFTPTVTDVDTYLWNFGDGDDETSTEANPVHTYAMSGTYTVTLIVKGEGGEETVTTKITLAVSLTEMLTGGPAAENGKTWVLNADYTDGDGYGPVQSAMPISTPSATNELALYGLEAEYDNEFTFFANGNFVMNPKNENALAGGVYGQVTESIVGDPANDIGMCAATFSPPASATWTLNETVLIVDAITDPMEEGVPPDHGNVTFSGKSWISLSAGAYFGILDFPSTERFIIKEITANKMNVALFLCGYYYGENPDDWKLPSKLIHMTFVPKAK